MTKNKIQAMQELTINTRDFLRDFSHIKSQLFQGKYSRVIIRDQKNQRTLSLFPTMDQKAKQTKIFSQLKQHAPKIKITRENLGEDLLRSIIGKNQ